MSEPHIRARRAAAVASAWQAGTLIAHVVGEPERPPEVPAVDDPASPPGPVGKHVKKWRTARVPRPGSPDRRRPARPRTGWPLRSRLAVALLAVACVVAVGISGRQWYAHQRLDAAHQAALAAAKQTTVDFTSINAASVDRDLQRIAAGATGEFKDEFTRGLPQVRTAIVENKVQSTGTVLRAGLVSGDLDSAVVLVALDATIKNTGAPDGRASHYRIQVDMARDAESGRWLVSRLQFVG